MLRYFGISGSTASGTPAPTTRLHRKRCLAQLKPRIRLVTLLQPLGFTNMHLTWVVSSLFVAIKRKLIQALQIR